MKLALNGALAIGTLDGANIEIAEAVGRENFFEFGHTVEELDEIRGAGCAPQAYYDADPELREAIDMISDGAFSPEEPGRFRPIVDSLLGSDHFMVLADYRSYLDCQDRVEAAYAEPQDWARRVILNVANMGCMSSDRAVAEYAAQIWGATPAEVDEPFLATVT